MVPLEAMLHTPYDHQDQCCADHHRDYDGSPILLDQIHLGDQPHTSWYEEETHIECEKLSDAVHLVRLDQLRL